jgi:GR25 family glycosyltransferase involved in LPS biosynthesis
MSTFYRKGYFTNMDEQEAAKMKVHYDFARETQRYDLLRNQAVEISKDFNTLAQQLKDNPESVVLDGACLLKDYKGLGKLIEDLKASREEGQRLESLMRRLGMADLIRKP